jgi:N-acetylneuraminic acid mutarotase
MGYKSDPMFSSKSIILPLFLLGAAFLAPLCEAGLTGFEKTASGAFPYGTATLLPSGKVLLTAGTSAELYDPVSRTWTPTGSLNDSRYGGHTATLLANGKVLVAGGISGAIFETQSAELYDPATGTWTPTGSLNAGRYSHTATLLPDGKVLVVGGFQQSSYHPPLPVPTAELYDPATGSWSVTGNLITGRGSHTATLLPNGKVLVAGGKSVTASYASAELYDPASGTWAETGSLATARFYHTATSLDNGKVLVAGGSINFSDQGNSQLASAELYDFQSGTWSPTGSLGRARVGHTATLLSTGKVLVVGGADGTGRPVGSAELYEPSSGNWAPTGSLITARFAPTATLLNDGTVLVAGGFSNNGDSNTPLSDAELYGKPMPTLLNISTRTNVRTGDKVLIGGFTIAGTEAKTIIVRGIGPSLQMANTLPDPVIEVHGPSGELLATNDNWRQAASSQQINDSGLAPSNELESALWGVINPGTYTVILSGKDGGTGVGSVEVYDLDEPADSRLANISTRGFVDTGDNVMIGGLIVGGGGASGTDKVVVRALGPSIPVADALANPTVELHDANGIAIASNDDWKTRPDGTSQQAEIEATTIPPSNDLESAFVRILSPGSYTAIVRGKDNTTGIGLVEVYHLP